MITLTATRSPEPVVRDEMRPAVRLEGVTKVFGHGPSAVTAVDGISLEAQPGEFLCLVGASGCGKTTLLNLVAGIEQPSAGTVARTGETSVMFQDPALFPWLSVARNVELPLKLAGVGKAERRERVALARALARDAPTLLMDEPFGALDAMTRDVMHDEIEQIWRETGRTIIFVTHNVREAIRLADRVLVLTSRPGRVAEELVVDLPRPRRIESPDVGALASRLTARLKQEVASHGHH